MNQPVSQIDFRELSVAERILLVEEIWDSIVEDQQALPLTQAQKDELDRRLKRHRMAPTEGAQWEVVKRRIRSDDSK